jgi:hypothetical protein
MVNGWDENKIKQFNEWINVCKSYNFVHDEKKEYYKKKETYLLVSTIIISSIVTIASSLSLILSYNFALNILSAVLAGLTTGINIYTKNDNAEQKITKHANSARGYREIVSRLEKELVLDLEHRTNGNDLINIISEQMLNLETGSESIPLITPEEYNRLDSTKHIIHSTTTKTEIVGSNNTYSRAQQQQPNDIAHSFHSIQLSSHHDNSEIKQDGNLDVETGNADIITGLSPSNNKKFELFFKKYPSSNQQMLNFQLNRINAKQ